MERLVGDRVEEAVDRGPMTAHEPRLTSLLVGTEGVEISLEANALPAVLQEANAHLRANRHDQAKACLDSPAMQPVLQAMASDSSRTDLLYVTAKLYLETEQFQEASEWLQRITTVEAHPIVFADLARCVEQVSGCRSVALGHWRRAHELAPETMAYREAYALCLRDVGHVQESVELCQEGLLLTEDRYTSLLQLIWGMHYVPDTRRADLFLRAKQWAATDPNRHDRTAGHANAPSPSRKLNIGIISGDFKSNSPLSNFDVALSCLDRDAFEWVAFSNVDHEDPSTADYRKLFDRFENIRGLTGHKVAARVRSLGIDILIAFAGQCQDNRLDVMVLKPAPVQVDWGGLCSLGLTQIDYRITDAVLDPPETQRYHQERLVYIPGGYVVYKPPVTSPPVTSLPARTNGYVTFGAFNNHLKMNAEIVALWARILLDTPHSRMLIKTPCAQDPGVRQTLLDRFARQGVEPQRISVSGQCSHYEHLRQLSQVDLLLDTYPFTSYRTALEGLWMGVPTVTRAGETYVSRMGLAILTQLGLGAFVAETPETYVGRACAFAAQWDELAQLREGLRPYLLASSVCDPTHFARGFEGLLRDMWRDWCAGREDKG